MPISKDEIQQIKQAIDIVSFIRSRGVKLQHKGKQYIGLCPFHNDRDPSLVVDSAKGLWNCLGACRTGGDIYRFVMKADSIDFKTTHQLLIEEAGPQLNKQTMKQTVKQTNKPAKQRTEQEPTEPTGQQTKEQETLVPGPVEIDWLERATAHYHACLLKTPQAQDYLKSRGLTSPEIATTFRLGFVDGSLLRMLPEEGREALKRMSLLNERGGEMMFGCVVFPLVQPATNQVVNLYGRNCWQNERMEYKAARHLYLPGMRRGIFNPQGAKNTEEVIITESVIDAAALWSTGLRSVVPAYGVTGLTDEIVSHLVDCRVKRVALMLDADEAGKGAALEMQARLEQSNIAARIVELPAKDASEYIAQGGTTYDIRALLTTSHDEESDKPFVLEQQSDGSYLMNMDKREYRIRGLSCVGMDRLKVNVRLTFNGNFHLDTLDLYQSRSRASFAHAAARVCSVSEQAINADLLLLIEQLEAARLLMRETDAQDNHAPMTPQEHDAALSLS